MGPIHADHQHGGERGKLDRNPHQPDVVGQERQVHGEQQDLIHRMVEAQIGRCEPPGLQFVTDITGAEDAGREADEAVEHDEDDVEIVDQQIGTWRRSADKQRQRRQQGDEGGGELMRAESR